MTLPTESTPQSEKPYQKLSKKERKETAEWLAEMIRNGELRPAKNQYRPITLKEDSSKEPGFDLDE